MGNHSLLPQVVVVYSLHFFSVGNGLSPLFSPHFQGSVEAPAADGWRSGALCHFYHYQYSHYSSLWCNRSDVRFSAFIYFIYILSTLIVRKGTLPVVLEFYKYSFLFVLSWNVLVSPSLHCPWEVNFVSGVVSTESRVL